MRLAAPLERAALKAEIKRARARGDSKLRAQFLIELEIPKAEWRPAVLAAMAELRTRPVERHGPKLAAKGVCREL